MNTFFKKPRKKKTGSKTEEPVQAALDTYLELRGIDFFRILDLLFKVLVTFFKTKRLNGGVFKIIISYLKGWPDNMVYIPLTDKYLLACPIECKSATGKTHGQQKVMARRLNYQIPRSPEETIEIVDQFIKDHERIKSIIVEHEKGSVKSEMS